METQQEQAAKRSTLHAIIYTNANGEVSFHEAENKQAAAEFIEKELGNDATKVLKLYKVSQALELKPKVVVTF